MSKNSFNALSEIETKQGKVGIYRLDILEKYGVGTVSSLPFSMKVMLEQALRQCDGFLTTEDDVKRLANYDAKNVQPVEMPFRPARVILQDFSGMPCLVDLAAMRSALARLGADPAKINPLVPVDMVIDHSVQVDFYGTKDAFEKNLAQEFKRNNERYQFAKWGQQALSNFRVVPPGTGIVHQVNLEYLAQVTMLKTQDGRQETGDGLPSAVSRLPIAYPDTLVGTDSHTTMINGLGVVGWGVGGIEAEAVMVGQPLYMVIPEVIGFKISGSLREGVTATDLTLTVVQMLRKKGVVEKFVEFYGVGLSNMSLADRATIANMAPEYGATMGYFPIDEETLRYMRATNRTDQADLTERYCKAQGMFRTDDTPDPVFTDTLELDLGSVEPSVAGPKRPQDRVPLTEVKKQFHGALTAPTKDRGFGLKAEELGRQAVITVPGDGRRTTDSSAISRQPSPVLLKHGAVVIAAITSCTNTSNPSVMLGAGLLAKKAVEKGLRVPAYVKTSLAPGSKVVTEYLKDAGLIEPLNALGFNVVGYGCTTCIGNSGPLPKMVADAVTASNIVTSAVISGNRNFEGRVHPLVKANYLASPPLVVAYALAGSTDIDLTSEPIGTGNDGNPVYLKDIWPSQSEIQAAIEAHIRPDMYATQYGQAFTGTEEWQKISGASSQLYAWDEYSTYIQEPPYFDGLSLTPTPIEPIVKARVLGLFGDSITTDHISPAGDIAVDSPAGAWLEDHDVAKPDFNQYGARRGNDKIMTRGTFANIRLKNLLVPGVEGGVTRYMGRRTEDGGPSAVSGQSSPVALSIFDVAMQYKADGVPLVILAGKEYGTGSSRDWAAKGSKLLGVRAVIAESYERIHRNNLVGMGVLPLQFKAGQSWELLGLKGDEAFDIAISDGVTPREVMTVTATRPDGSAFSFEAVARLDTPIEVEYYKNGGILPTVLRGMAGER